MHGDLLPITADGHGAPAAAVRWRHIDKEHLTIVTITYLQTVLIRIAYKHYCIPCNDGKARRSPDSTFSIPDRGSRH